MKRSLFYHGTYKGPIPRLQGQTALLRVISGQLYAQFDDLNEEDVAYGWIALPRQDFYINRTGSRKCKKPLPANKFTALLTGSWAPSWKNSGRAFNPAQYRK